MIALGFKWIELRSWKTDYRGWILICASKAINKEEKATLMNGHAVARLVKRRFQRWRASSSLKIFSVEFTQKASRFNKTLIKLKNGFLRIENYWMPLCERK